MDHSRDEQGMATAEYAVGTLGAACIGCVVFKLLGDDTSWLDDIFQRISDIVGWIGIHDPTLPRI